MPVLPFKTFIKEASGSNTDAADINEIMLGYYLADGWNKFEGSSDAKRQLDAKVQKLGREVGIDQANKAEAMAQETIKWSKANGYNGKVKKVWWTARPGILAKAVGQEVDSRKNPTDVLVQFTDGTFLGLSAKSTKTMGDIGFKNPGLGTVEKNLNLKLSQILQKAVETLLKEFPSLPKSSSARKAAIRADNKIKDRAEELGTKVLGDIRNSLYNRLKKMEDQQLIDYLLDDWMDAKNSVFPRYIKITGFKEGAKVEDPLKNSKIAAISTGNIKLDKVGNDSIGVVANGKRIMKMRAKFESQKLASSVKFSGDPWK